MIFNGTVTLGNIIEIACIIGSVAIFLIKNTFIIEYMKKELADVQVEIKKLSDIITSMAITDLRLTNLEHDVRELRHGKGFISQSIDGEYTSTGKVNQQ